MKGTIPAERIEEVADRLERKARTLRTMVAENPEQGKARRLAKASAYEDAVQLLCDEIEAAA